MEEVGAVEGEAATEVEVESVATLRTVVEGGNNIVAVEDEVIEAIEGLAMDGDKNGKK